MRIIVFILNYLYEEALKPSIGNHKRQRCSVTKHLVVFRVLKCILTLRTQVVFVGPDFVADNLIIQITMDMKIRNILTKSLKTTGPQAGTPFRTHSVCFHVCSIVRCIRSARGHSTGLLTVPQNSFRYLWLTIHTFYFLGNCNCCRPTSSF